MLANLPTIDGIAFAADGLSQTVEFDTRLACVTIEGSDPQGVRIIFPPLAAQISGSCHRLQGYSHVGI